MGLSDVLNIGQSALAAAQIGLQVTGNNIANASTPGYSRELAMQTESQPQGFGYGFVGSGVTVSTVQRMYSSFATQQVNSAQASSSNLTTYYNQLQQVDNMLGDTTSGLSPTMQSFFAGVQTMASNPASLASRQAMLSDAQTLASQVQGMGSQIDQLAQGVNTQIQTSVNSINSIASQIAQLNTDIVNSQASAANQPANSLLDQRDQLVNQLNQQVSASVVSDGNGNYNIFIGNGQALVVGGSTYNLSVAQSNLDPTQLAVAYTANNKTTTLPDSALTGGQLGGILAFRDQSLNSAQNQLGLLALNIGTQFNNQQALGVDLNGKQGAPLFTVGSPTVTSASSNSGTGALAASISDPTQLTGQDYQLTNNNGTYVLSTTTGSTVATFTSFPQTVAGLTLNMSGAPQNGDRFLIRPTANSADQFSVALTNPAGIAAAVPITTATVADNLVLSAVGSGNSGSGIISQVQSGSNPASPLTAPVTLTYNSGSPATLTGFPTNQPVTVTTPSGTTTSYAAGQPVPYTDGSSISFQGLSFTISGTPHAGDTFTLTNGGTGTISAGSVSSAYFAAPITTPITLTYNAATGALSGFPAADAVAVTQNGSTTTYPAGTNVPYSPGATLSFGGMSVSISGTLVNNDTFTISPNTAVSGDNRNALLMGQLQNQKNIQASSGNASTFSGYYASLMSSVASKTSELSVTSTSESNVLKNWQQTQQSVSGVNLNEEANNLLQYQQAYQAAGKLMQIASQLFNTLLSVST